MGLFVYKFIGPIMNVVFNFLIFINHQPSTINHQKESRINPEGSGKN